ncbi:lipoyl(octanoyl) transferase LipB [Rhodococcus sp. WS4]|nr:lipoyl(octanoyl) transferase LipB [Rhodococcus sp. WS4]
MTLPTRVSTSVRASLSPLHVLERGTLDYRTAWDEQHRLVDMRIRDTCDDTLLLVEHPFVYTAGSRTQQSDRPQDGSPVIDVDRGGRITWHGPGQLVGYLIVKLGDGRDGVEVVRRIEQAIIHVCAELGIEANLVGGRSGVWVPTVGSTDSSSSSVGSSSLERKIAAVGMRVQRGVTFHGFSLNCNNEFNGFESIIPCGIPDAGVTSLSRELSREVTTSDVLPAVRSAIAESLDRKIADG